MELLLIIIIFLIAALVSIIVKHRKIIEISSLIASVFGFIISLTIALKVSTMGTYSPFPFFSIDALGAIMILIITFVGTAATIYSIAYLKEETDKKIIGFTRVKQYFILLNLFLLAMFLSITTSSPIFAWISIEATTLSTAFLISFYNKPSAMEAAWKYLIINSIGLLLALFGTLLYFTSVTSLTGNILISWHSLADNVSHLDPLIAKIAFIFILIGYGTKIGFVPMHTWLPDAHSKAPAPISALLSGVLLNTAFIIMLRFRTLTDGVVPPSFSQTLLIIFGIASILIAALIILTQENYKRILAYSSIENMGVIAIGFGFGGLGVFAAILHMIYHSLLKSSLFLSAGTIFLKYSSTKIINIKGAIKILPFTSIIFLTGFLAITGMPPFGIFLTKLFILSIGIKVQPIVMIVMLILMAILFIGFFMHVSSMLFGEKPGAIKIGEVNIWLIIPPLFLLLTALYLSIYIPSFLYILLNEATTHY